MYQSLLQKLREEGSNPVEPQVVPEKPKGFMGGMPKKVVDSAPKYNPMNFTQTGVSRVVEARQKFQQKLAQDMAESQRKAQVEITPVVEKKAGFLSKPSNVPTEEKTSLGTILPASANPATGNSGGSSGGGGVVKALHTDLGSFEAPANELTAAAQAIKDIESGGGNYTIRGPVVAKGRYAGERAMGAYQIMPGNLPQWSKEALGRQVSEEEFLASPKIQDEIFLDQFTKSYKKHGNFADAASIWFTGQPVAKSGGRDDGYTSSNTYISKFTSGYNRYLNAV